MNTKKNNNVLVQLLNMMLIGCLLVPVGYGADDEIAAALDMLGRDDPFAQVSEIGQATTKRSYARSPYADEATVTARPPLLMQSIDLKYMTAADLMQAAANMSSPYGMVVMNEKTNSIVVCDTEEDVERIMAEIRKVDKAPHQIMIEAVILDIQIDDESAIGVNWDILSDKSYDTSYRQSLGSRLISTVEDDDTIANATAFNTTSLAGVEGGYFALISGTVRNTVHLLQEKKNVEILASPRIMVVSGETASIETVEEIPYREVTETSEGGELATTEFKNVGVKLNVSATITDQDFISVTIEPEQSVNTGRFGTSEDVPIVDTRKAKTTLMLRDGNVVALGGLRRKETSHQIKQVPLLGDLPLIGFLFRDKQEVVKNSELVVIMSTHIYRGKELTPEQQEKWDEITKRPLLQMPEDKNTDLWDLSKD